MRATSKSLNKKIACGAVAGGIVRPPSRKAKRHLAPVWEKDRCVRCGVCFVFCPHGSVHRVEDGFFDRDEDRCRGCGVCHRECWFGVIHMVEEA